MGPGLLPQCIRIVAIKVFMQTDSTGQCGGHYVAESFLSCVRRGSRGELVLGASRGPLTRSRLLATRELPTPSQWTDLHSHSVV
jgi:hypothetical protein